MKPDMMTVGARDPEPQEGVKAVPIPGQVISVVLSFAAITVLTMFMSMCLTLILLTNILGVL